MLDQISAILYSFDLSRIFRVNGGTETVDPAGTNHRECGKALDPASSQVGQEETSNMAVNDKPEPWKVGACSYSLLSRFGELYRTMSTFSGVSRC